MLGRVVILAMTEPAVVGARTSFAEPFAPSACDDGVKWENYAISASATDAGREPNVPSLFPRCPASASGTAATDGQSSNLPDFAVSAQPSEDKFQANLATASEHAFVFLTPGV